MISSPERRMTQLNFLRVLKVHLEKRAGWGTHLHPSENVSKAFKRNHGVAVKSHIVPIQSFSPVVLPLLAIKAIL